MKLHDYQQVAVDHLRRNNRACLFLDMGLGKTAATLSALTPDHLPALVVAPKRVAEHVWLTESRLWRPDLRVGVAKGTPTQRRQVLDAPADVHVLGRDNLKDLDRGRPLPYRTLILDELSGFKTRNTTRWKTLNRVLRTDMLECDHVWGLTGTPTPNGLMDLWAQLALIDRGQRLGTGISAFRSRYFMPGRQLANGVITEWVLRPESEQRIHELIDDICLSMSTDGRIELPPVTYNPVNVTLPPDVMRTYKDLKRDLIVNLQLLGGEVHTAANAAVLSGKLSQISAGFIYSDDADLRPGAHTELHREKIKAVQEVVEGTGSPVLVFYRFQQELKALQEAFGESAESLSSNDPTIIDRWNRGEIPVLLAHPASAGHGLNLQHGGHTIVWTTLPWSLEEWQQANKRLARQGQKHPVVIHMIMANRTIDTAIRARLMDKATVQDALLSHLESPL